MNELEIAQALRPHGHVDTVDTFAANLDALHDAILRLTDYDHARATAIFNETVRNLDFGPRPEAESRPL